MDWTEEATTTMLFHFRAGAKFKDIASLLGTSEKSIQGRVDRLQWKADTALMEERAASGGSVNKPMDWDKPGMMEAFRQLFEDGRGYRVISAKLSEQFGPVSRSACIGKASRLGWERSAPPVQPRTPKPKKQFTLNIHRSSPHGAGDLIAFKAEKRKQFTGIGDATPETAITLMELTEHTCRWPYGESNFKFCGKSDMHGLPYCPDHMPRSREARFLCAAE